jgi:nucleoside-diphosphate-sugar epimerase
MTHPILVTGAAGRVGGVGGLVVEALQRRGPFLCSVSFPGSCGPSFWS